MKLAAAIAARLEERNVGCAVIGAVAAAVHGYSRATLDVDFLVLDPCVLDPQFWNGFEPAPDIRRGDPFDPLLGVVRWRTGSSDAADVVVGKGARLRRVLERARKDVETGLPIASALDVCLLKLDAGGGQDLLDVSNLIAANPALSGEIEGELPDFPPDAGAAWEKAKQFPAR